MGQYGLDSAIGLFIYVFIYFSFDGYVLWLEILTISSQLHIQRCHISILNLAIVRIFILWESAKATDQDFLGSGKEKHLYIFTSTPLGVCLVV